MSVNIYYNEEKNDRCGCHPSIRGFDPNCIQCGEALKKEIKYLEDATLGCLKKGDYRLNQIKGKRPITIRS